MAQTLLNMPTPDTAGDTFTTESGEIYIVVDVNGTLVWRRVVLLVGENQLDIASTADRTAGRALVLTSGNQLSTAEVGAGGPEYFVDTSVPLDIGTIDADTAFVFVVNKTTTGSVGPIDRTWFAIDGFTPGSDGVVTDIRLGTTSNIMVNEGLNYYGVTFGSNAATIAGSTPTSDAEFRINGESANRIRGTFGINTGITDGDGLTAVSSDDTLSGNGTSVNPLGVSDALRNMFLLINGFLLLTRTTSADVGTREAYVGRLPGFDTANQTYYFDSSDSSWYDVSTGGTALIGFQELGYVKTIIYNKRSYSCQYERDRTYRTEVCSRQILPSR